MCLDFYFKSGICYADREYYQQQYYEIISLEEYKRREGLMEFEVGDTIRLKMDATLEDLTKDCWNGCATDTSEFIKEADVGKEYIVKGITEFGNIIVSTNYDKETLVNPNVVELVKKAEPKVKEVTMEELEKHYGCKVKVIK